LAGVVGRQADLLRTPDGRQVPGLYFPHLLKDFSSVRQFQVVQERLDEVVLKVVAPGATPGDLERITAAAQGVLGSQVRFSIQCVETISLTRAGKLLVVKSSVQPD
jgi:phenylacetate-CoA ligase